MADIKCLKDKEPNYINVWFMVGGNEDEYIECNRNKNGVLFGYVKDETNVTGELLGEKQMYRPEHTYSGYVPFVNPKDLFSSSAQRLKVIFEDGQFLGPAGSLLTKGNTTFINKGCFYRVKTGQRSKNRSMFSTETLKAHCLNLCVSSKCSICVKQIDIPEQYFVMAEQNSEQILKDLQTFNLDKKSKKKRVHVSDNEDEEDVTKSIVKESIKDIKEDESVALKEEQDNEFQTYKRLSIPDQVKDKKPHKRLIVIDSDEEEPMPKLAKLVVVDEC